MSFRRAQFILIFLILLFAGGLTLVVYRWTDTSVFLVFLGSCIVVGGTVIYIFGGWTDAVEWARGTFSRTTVTQVADRLPLDVVTAEQLRGELVRGGRVEWVDRDAVSPSDLRREGRIAIIGQRKLGKTREAIELIDRLTRGRPAYIVRPSPHFAQLIQADWRSVVRQQLHNASLTVLFVDDLPYRYRGDSLTALGDLLTMIRGYCDATYFVTTMRTDQIEDEHRQWLEKHHVVAIELATLDNDQLRQFVGNALDEFDFTATNPVIDILVTQGDGTPERPLNVLRILSNEQNSGQLGEKDEKQVRELIHQEIGDTWAENRRRIAAYDALAGKLVDSLSLFHAARLTPYSQIIALHAAPWTLANRRGRAWQHLAAYDFDVSEAYVRYLEVAVEGLHTVESALAVVEPWLLAQAQSPLRRFHLRLRRANRAMSFLFLDLAEGSIRRVPADKINLYTCALAMYRHYGFYTNRGLAYRNKQEYDRAIADYDEAIRLNPEYATAFYNRGNAYAAKHLYDRAIADYDEAIRLNPEDADAFTNRGNAYADKHLYDRAIADYDEAIRLNPEYATAFTNRGAAYADKHLYDRAIADCDEAIRLNPEDADAFYNRGSAYAEKQLTDRAIADYDEAIRLNPEYATAFYNRGLAYAMLQRYAAAARSFEAAVALDGDMWTYVTIAGCYRQLGEAEQAESYLALARPLLPEQDAYNQACYAAIAGNRERALALLAQALHDDPTQKAWAALDPDFAFIRDDPRFQALIT